MKAFSGKISDSLKDTVSSITNLTGLTKNNLTKTLEETKKQVDNFNGKTNDNSLKIRNSMLSQELALKAEINSLLKNPPSENEYYTNDGVIDTSKPENLKKVQERYKSDLQFMLQKL